MQLQQCAHSVADQQIKKLNKKLKISHNKKKSDFILKFKILKWKVDFIDFGAHEASSCTQNFVCVNSVRTDNFSGAIKERIE